MNILIVDDSPTMIKVLTKSFNNIGFSNIDSAENGRIAIDILKQNNKKYDLVMIDWNMPIMNGKQLIEEIKKENDFADIKIIVVTTEAEKNEILNILKTGINDYIIKPFDNNLFVDKITKITKI